MKFGLKLFQKTTWTVSFGLCSLLSGIFLFSYGNSMGEAIMDAFMVLGPNSLITNYWKAPDPLSLDFYLFNWTNPEDIRDPNSKPNFVEMGPYKFKETKVKVNLTWNPDNDTVTYYQLRTWYYLEDHPSRNLDEEITTINPVTVTAAFQARYWSYFSKKGLSITLSTLSPNLHVTKRARELIFDGYQDKLLDVARFAQSLYADSKLADKFSYMYTRNGSFTYDGAFNMETGTNGGNIGALKGWKYRNETPYSEGYCSKIGGSAGEIFGRYSSRSVLDAFSAEACRRLIFEYEEDVTLHYMNCYKYSVQDRILDNGTLYPEAKCICDGECVPSGMLNLTSCKAGAPIFTSLPHYYLADPVYLTMVDGMKPEKAKHEMYITIEPKSGVPLIGYYRVQFNIRLQPIKDITLFEEVPDVFIPMFWFEQKFELSNRVAWLIWILLNLPLLFTSIATVLIITGVVAISYVVYNFVYKRKSYQRVQLNVETMQDENENSYQDYPKFVHTL